MAGPSLRSRFVVGTVLWTAGLLMIGHMISLAAISRVPAQSGAAKSALELRADVPRVAMWTTLSIRWSFFGAVASCSGDLNGQRFRPELYGRSRKAFPIFRRIRGANLVTAVTFACSRRIGAINWTFVTPHLPRQHDGDRRETNNRNRTGSAGAA